MGQDSETHSSERIDEGENVDKNITIYNITGLFEYLYDLVINRRLNEKLRVTDLVSPVSCLLKKKPPHVYLMFY